MSTAKAVGQSIPVLLLKTKSIPNDGYEEHFLESGVYDPVFVPVLEHKFDAEGLQAVNGLLARKLTTEDGDLKYGGMIFTSQRAVEAFAKIVTEFDVQSHAAVTLGSTKFPHLDNIPIYTVGPATSRALKSIETDPPLQIFGEETGNGEALAHFMLEHYNNWYAGVSTTDKQDNLPVLFLVGDQRRDIIPKTLMDPNLSSERRIGVREIVVYGTGVMEPFEQEFMNLLTETEEKEIRWVVVFSPTGCEAMLRALGMLDMETGRVKTGERGGGCGVRKGKRRTYIATIGPTTRDYLRKTFGFEPDVCAEKPSPEGISIGIQKFMDSLKDC